MSKEISNPLQLIEASCRTCPKLESCLFGKPALTVIDSTKYDNEVQSAAVTYIWNKRASEVIKMCPKPEEVAKYISVLEQKQSQKPKRSSQNRSAQNI